MIDPFTLLAVIFGIATVILAFGLICYRHEARQLRDLCDELIDSGNELVDYHDTLKARNIYLETTAMHTRELIAAGMMFAPKYRTPGERMTIRETQEMP